MTSTTTDSRDRPETGGREQWELVLNLFRTYPLQATFPDITRVDKRREMARQVMGFQEDLLRRLHLFQERFSTFHRLLEGASLRAQSFEGYRSRTLRALRRHQPELVRAYYDALDAIIDLYPHLPPVRFIIPDHQAVALVRAFEREAQAVYVTPIQAITASLLFDICRIATDDGLVYPPTYLGVHVDELARDDLVRLKLRMVGPLESKIVFRDGFAPERVYKLLNAIQGQIEGHVNRLLALLRSGQLATYLQDSLRRVKERILPEVMAGLRPELDEVLAAEARIFSRRTSRERVCLRDDLVEQARRVLSLDLRGGEKLTAEDLSGLDVGLLPEALRAACAEAGVQLAVEAPLTASWPGHEWLVTDTAGARYLMVRAGRRLEVLVEGPLNRAWRLIERLRSGEEDELPWGEVTQTTIHLLEEYARHTRELRGGNLPRKHTLIRAELHRVMPVTQELFDRYLVVFDTAHRAIHPFMGMVSFSPGGTSNFYVRWFAGLRDFLEFEILVLRERLRTLEAAIAQEEVAYARRQEIADELLPRVAPLARGLRYARLLPEDQQEDQQEDGDDEAAQDVDGPGDAPAAGADDDGRGDSLSPRDLAEMLADYYCLMTWVHALPPELFRIERDILYNLRKKRTFALKLSRARRTTTR